MNEKKSKIGKLIYLYLLKTVISQIFLVLFCVSTCLIPAWFALAISGFQMFLNFALPLFVVSILYFQFYVRKKILTDSERELFINTINEKIQEVKDNE